MLGKTLQGSAYQWKKKKGLGGGGKRTTHVSVCISQYHAGTTGLELQFAVGKEAERAYVSAAAANLTKLYPNLKDNKKPTAKMADI